MSVSVIRRMSNAKSSLIERIFNICKTPDECIINYTETIQKKHDKIIFSFYLFNH